MALNLRQKVLECLEKNAGKKLTTREIAQWIFQHYPKECEEKRQSSSQDLSLDTSLIAQIMSEISCDHSYFVQNNHQIKAIETRPRQYYFLAQSDKEEAEEIEKKGLIQKGTKARLSEHDLYPLIADYFLQEHDVYLRRIDEKKSSNKQGKNGNVWLHPDIAGMQDLGRNWELELQECVRVSANQRVALWSIEAKLLINRSNLREYYFQAVSNSSWANHGYLVAAEISGVGTLDELRLLHAAHGIGLILLDIEDVTESQIIIPAKIRDVIDWNMINRIAVENKDFMNYVKSIRRFHQTGDIAKSDWLMTKTHEPDSQ